MQTDKKQSYDTLSRRISLTVITVSIAPLILVGGLIFDQVSSIYHEKTYAHLAEVVDKHKDMVDTFLREKTNEIQYLERVFTFRQLADPTLLAHTLKGLQQQYGRIFVDLGIIDRNGIQVAYAGPLALQGADYSDADWYKNSRNRETAISDVFMGLRQSPHFIITVNNREEPDWTLRATIDFLAFTSLVENIRMGETGYAYILNRKGTFQTRPRTGERLTFSTERSTSIPSPVKGVAIREADANDGETYLTVSAPLNNGEWKLVYQQNVSDAFSALKRSEFTTLAIFLVGGIAIVLMTVIITRQIVARFRAADRESELMNRQVVETGKLAAIGELAAGIAHEINNPVAIMVEEAGWVSDLLQDEAPTLRSGAEINRALGQVRTQGRRCKDITHKLLSFARQTDSAVGAVNLPELIREVVDISMQQARYSQVGFDLRLDSDIPNVWASTTELQQVFLNLINNSIQAMEAEGGTLSINCHNENGLAIITVADTGPGIPASNLSRIFDPFFTTKPVGKGSGLGLSICFGIIHQMGGDIDVESAVGHGTRFIIRLPFPPTGYNHEPQKEIHHD